MVDHFEAPNQCGIAWLLTLLRACMQNGATPLYVAALNGQKEVAEVLLKAGARVDSSNEVREKCNLWHTSYLPKCVLVT